MKKLLLAGLLAVASLVVFLPSASTHGSCASPAFQPTRSGGQVHMRGRLDCSEVHSLAVYLTVRGERRQVGGSWVNLGGTATQNMAPTDDIPTQGPDFPYDCRKDYRTVAAGTAQNTAGGSGHSPLQNSVVLFHSC